MSPIENLDPALDGASPPGLSLTFVGLTRAVARVTHSADGSILVTGPASVFKLTPLEQLAEHCTAAISAQTKVCRDLFALQVGLKLDKFSSCHSVAELTCSQPVSKDHATAVVLSLLNRLKQCDDGTQDILPAVSIALSESAQEAIDSSALAILSAMGGSPIAVPVDILVGERQIASFRGMYRPKPDHSQFNTVKTTLEGTCDGFKVKKRCLFLESEGKSVFIHWESKDQQDQIIKLASDPTVLRRLEVNRTLDRLGNPLYTYVGVSPDS